MFEPNYGWSLPAHLFAVSGWSAKCARPSDPMSCKSDLSDPPEGPASTRKRFPNGPLYGWTDLTYLLHRHKVSWGYYLVPGAQPDCDDGARLKCDPGPLKIGTPSIWNPLPEFTTVRQDHQLEEHPAGHRLRRRRPDRLAPRGLVGRPGLPPQRASGLTDHARSGLGHEPRQRGHERPGLEEHRDLPRLGRLGRLLRPCRSLRASTETATACASPRSSSAPMPSAATSTTRSSPSTPTSSSSRTTSSEESRLDPKTDGRPDPRPTVREDVPVLGDLVKDFDFSQTPRAPYALVPSPPPGQRAKLLVSHPQH